MRARLLALAAAIAVASPVRAQSESDLLVIVPEGTRGELVDALRVELRGRGVGAAFVRTPSAPRSDEEALALARAHRASSVLWLAPSDNPLAPPDARYATEGEPGASRAARLPAAADAVDARTFALTLAELLDPPPPLEALDDPGANEVPAPPSDPPATEPAAEPPASDPASVGEPPRIFYPSFRPRLAFGAGAVQNDHPFHVSVALDLAVQVTPWLVFAGDLTGWYAPGPERAGLWGGIGFGGTAEGLPGTLTITAEGGGAVFDDSVGLGGAVVARWEWPIDDVLRLGPRVAFHLWKPVLSADPQPPDVGYYLLIGIDLLGLDLRID